VKTLRIAPLLWLSRSRRVTIVTRAVARSYSGGAVGHRRRPPLWRLPRATGQAITTMPPGLGCPPTRLAGYVQLAWTSADLDGKLIYAQPLVVGR